ncbi:hypothetical protein LINPERHAP1_LOCUS13160 [Linum perenne]
MTAARFD